MKTSTIYFIALFLTLLPCCSNAQSNPFWDVPTGNQADSLKIVLEASKNDTFNIYINRQIGMHYQERNRPVALAYYEEMLMLAKKTKQPLWEAEAHSRVGYVSCLMQNYAGGLKSLLLAQKMVSQPKAEQGMWSPGLLSRSSNPYDVRLTVMADINQHLGIVHYFTGDFTTTLSYNRQVQTINEKLNDDALGTTMYLNMGEAYFGLNQLDSAAFAFNKSLTYSDKSGFKKYKGLVLYDMGRINESRKNYEESKEYYRLSIQINREEESPDFEGMGYQALANLSQQSGDIDSVFFFSRKALHIYLNINDTIGLIAAYSSLSFAFDAMNQMDSAYHYLKKGIALKDGLNKEERIKSFQLTGLNEQFKLQALEAAQLRIKTNIRTYSFISGIAVLLLLTAVFYRNYRRQKKDRHTIEKAFADLKATQSQLIQSEKMASLGELTAGIAHEIQNPLNFVNNFSEVSKELIDEVQSERSKVKSERDELLEEELLNDISQNLEKINHHGKRADAIVKGMLQHSKSSSGQKELTDINALCDEYLRLSYHGLKAKDPQDAAHPSFYASFHFEPDDSLPKANVVPQDMGIVLLNLINNAFYAVQEKKTLGQAEGDSFEPTVTVSTRKVKDKLEIMVKDNGNGIPQNLLDKIFQPFFTTKPTGQGTGLGLSLSYDIVKAHGGEIKVNTKDNEGSEFTIQLPFELKNDDKA